MKKILYIFALLFAVSCVEQSGFEPEESKVPVSVNILQTRTTIQGNQILFAGSEAMTLVCQGVNAAKVSNGGANPNLFTGQFRAIGSDTKNSTFYAVYPYIGLTSNGNQSCLLPHLQKAPFDGNANYMCSYKASADYNEENMPELTLSMTQLMGIVKVSFTNTSAQYKDELVKNVILTSSTQLVGEFTIDFSDEGMPVPVFYGDDPTCRRVNSSYPTPVTLGLDKVHEVYMFVNPAQIKDAELTVITDKHEFRRQAAGAFTAVQGDITYMDPMDLATTFSAADLDIKTLVVWGDSYTNRGQEYTYVDRCNYAYHLQQMLGSGWKIYNGGCSSDVTNTIAARQGGIQLCTGSAFTIPAETSAVTIDGLFSSKDYGFNDGAYTKIAHFGLINPAEIVIEDASGNEVARVEGNFTSSGTVFTRTTAGEAIDVPANSKVVTFAAKNLRNPDLTIIYMGQNGGFTTLDVLYKQYRAMIDFAFPEGPENYIAMGFHNHNTLRKWNTDNAYWDFFDGPQGFGVNEAEGRPISRFLNLYKELTGPDYKKYLVMSGAAASEDDVNQNDMNYVERGMIPYSYWYYAAGGDIHPNEYGGKAFASVIYKKIVELGYLN